MARSNGSLVVYGSVLTDGREWAATRIEVVDGRIATVASGASAAGADIVADGWIVPGLIDLQVNGAGGVDLTADERPDAAVAHVGRTLVAHGVTAFCPTVISSPPQTVLERLGAFRPRARPDGATSLGAHLEGPFLNATHRGAHDLASLRVPDEPEIERWLSVCRPSIVTLAAELPKALDAVRQLAAAGTIVSLGHSGADAHTARSALSAGASMGTHLFNGMPPMHHRRPGLVGTLLLSSANLGLICDGVHVDPLIVELAVRLAGVERVVLVSDAAAPAGLGTEEAASAGVRRPDGTLAGSAVLLDACLRNVRSWLRWLTPGEVLLMATRTPAVALGGVASRKGRIAAGYDADLAILDADWNVATTIVGGRVVFRHGVVQG